KVIAPAPPRADAARRLARALQRAEIHGVTTNRDLLVAILREPEFLAGGTDTGYLTRHDLAAPLARQAPNRATAPVLASLPSGWRNVRSAPQQVTYDAAGQSQGQSYT